jgi:hypothetical protein
MSLNYYSHEARNKKEITQVVWVVSLIFGTWGLFTTPNPLETFVSCLIFPILFSLLWQLGELPVFLFAASFQSLEIITPIFNANSSGMTLEEIFRGPELASSFYFSIISIIVLAIGMKIGLGKQSNINFSEIHLNASQLTPSRLAIAYVFFFIFSLLLSSFAFVNPSITQFILPISSLKWFVTFLIGWAGLRQDNFKPLMYIVLATEVIFGFTGFFSGFKTIFFLFIVLASGNIKRLKDVLQPTYLFLFVAVLILTIYWQSVKSDYRNYVNLGTNTQSVQVSVIDIISFHFNNINDFNLESFNDGLDSGLKRLGYLDFFAHSIRQVPTNIPHQNGRLWFEVIRHILTPRFLFPDKPPINDSDRTNEFTRLGVAGADRGTSISIGYMGESYIDFGFPLMIFPIFILGYFWGRSYRTLINISTYPLLGLAAGTIFLLSFGLSTGGSNLKIVGGAVSTLILYSLILKFFDKRLWQCLAIPNPNK